MTTRLTITNAPDSPSAQALVIAASMTQGGPPYKVLKPGESVDYQMLTASSLSIEERDATGIVPMIPVDLPSNPAQNKLAKPLPKKARKKPKHKMIKALSKVAKRKK